LVNSKTAPRVNFHIFLSRIFLLSKPATGKCGTGRYESAVIEMLINGGYSSLGLKRHRSMGFQY
jgi:hypothetical protein